MNEEQVSVSYETKCVVYLNSVFRNGDTLKHLGPSTGFFWRSAEGIPYLITCRHCITGRDSKNRLIPGCNDDPTGLQFYFRTPEASDGEASFYKNRNFEFSLWKDGNPDWQEHPRGAEIDLVALQFDTNDFHIHCVNDKEQYEHWRPHVGDECFVVGFPEGLAGSEGTPVWKRASIATEPELEFKGLPAFLCDTATRKGMSGSPVFSRMNGGFKREGLDQNLEYSHLIGGYWTKFIGIYAGREGDENDGFQLGRVLKEQLVIETISNTKKPKSPFIAL